MGCLGVGLPRAVLNLHAMVNGKHKCYARPDALKDFAPWDRPHQPPLAPAAAVPQNSSPPQNVDELRQFVQLGSTEKCPTGVRRDHPGRPVMRPVFCCPFTKVRNLISVNGRPRYPIRI